MENKKLKSPSEEFLEAIVHAGSGVISCEFCERVHFVLNPEEYDWESGEHEKLLAQSRENPDKFVVHNWSSIPWGNLDGKQYVAGCPCNSAAKYEEFIVGHRHSIVSYLKARAEKQLREAQRESKLIESL